MPPSELKWFKSEIDWWIGSIIVGVPVLELALLVSSLQRGDREATVAVFAGCAFVAAIYALLVIPVRYGIGDDVLVVRFGVVRQRIPFTSIREVYPTHAPLSSAALSLDRLAVRTGRGFLGLTLISPREREEFIALLARKANLMRNGERLTQANA